MRQAGRKCEEILSNGSQCRAWAIRDSVPPRCTLHSLSAEERKARSQRAASVSALVRRGNAEPAGRSGLAPDVSLADVLDVIAPALGATFAHDGSPDWSARLSAAGVLVASFPRQYRETPEDVHELLERILPTYVYDRERMEAQRVYSAMRAEWDALQKCWHPMRGLYVKPYPPHMIAPWENAERVQRERPAEIPPDKASVRHYPDGGIALDRGPHELPLLLEQEDDGGLMYARTILP